MAVIRSALFWIAARLVFSLLEAHDVGVHLPAAVAVGLEPLALRVRGQENEQHDDQVPQEQLAEK